MSSTDPPAEPQSASPQSASPQSALPRSSLLRVTGNAASLLTTELLNKATNFLIYALIARYELGLGAFGSFSLGLLLVYVFQVFASVGLPNLLTREIAQRVTRAPRLLSNGLVAASLTSLLAMLAMFVTPWIMRYDPTTSWVIVVLSLGLWPYAASQVFEASFRGTQRMHFIALANMIANTGKVLGAIWLLHHGYGVVELAGLLVAVRFLVLLTDMVCYFGWSGDRLVSWDRRYVIALVRRSSTFLGIDAAIAGWSAVDALILSKIMSPQEVGLYSAALQLLQPASLVYLSIVGSIFPAMCHRHRQSMSDLQGLTTSQAREQMQLYALTRWMVAFLLMLGLPAVVLIFSFADVILQLAYNDAAFVRSIPVMQIACFALITQCFTTILGHALWAADHEGETLRIVITNLTANLIISSITIYNWGLIGAVAGTLLVSFLNVLQHYLAYMKVLHKHPIDWQIVNPIVAAVAMVCVLGFVPNAIADGLLGSLPLSLQGLIAEWLPNPQRYVLALLGVVVYAASILTLISVAHGGPRKLRDGFFAPLVS